MKELCTSFQWSWSFRGLPTAESAAELPASLQKEMESRQVSDMENETCEPQGVDLSCLTNSTAWFIFRV